MSELTNQNKQIKQSFSVKKEQLPLSCPMPDSELWDMHPKVYLSIEDKPDGIICCPYCGTEYRLQKD